MKNKKKCNFKVGDIVVDKDTPSFIEVVVDIQKHEILTDEFELYYPSVNYRLATDKDIIYSICYDMCEDTIQMYHSIMTKLIHPLCEERDYYDCLGEEES